MSPDKPRGAVKLLLPPTAVLTRQIELPILPASDVKRMVALDLDRLTPFRADQALFDTEIVGRDEARGKQTILIGVMTKAAIARALDHARAHHLEPAAIGLAAAGAGSFDFLSALREAEGGSALRRRTSYWWVAAAVLLGFNLFMLSYRDAAATNQLRESVESQQAPVSVAMRLRDKVQKEAVRRAILLKQKKQNSPLPILEAVTETLPNDAWVERFEWNGKTVHIRGQRKDTSNLLAKLEASPVLRNAHSLASDARTAPASAGSFDLAADREMERAR